VGEIKLLRGHRPLRDRGGRRAGQGGESEGQSQRAGALLHAPVRERRDATWLPVVGAFDASGTKANLKFINKGKGQQTGCFHQNGVGNERVWEAGAIIRRRKGKARPWECGIMSLLLEWNWEVIIRAMEGSESRTGSTSRSLATALGWGRVEVR
jgi:hypothetical protein